MVKSHHFYLTAWNFTIDFGSTLATCDRGEGQRHNLWYRQNDSASRRVKTAVIFSSKSLPCLRVVRALAGLLFLHQSRYTKKPKATTQLSACKILLFVAHNQKVLCRSPMWLYDLSRVFAPFQSPGCSLCTSQSPVTQTRTSHPLFTKTYIK